jgi:hypothetical protein
MENNEIFIKVSFNFMVMKVWFLVILMFLALTITGCHEEVNPDIYEQSCKSDKPVPINCEKFQADDYSGTLQFAIKEIDRIELNYSTIIITGINDCKKKSSKKMGTYYYITMDCKKVFFNQNITGTLEFDYIFMGKTKHTIISYKRLFGKYDPFFDRKPLDDFNV